MGTPALNGNGNDYPRRSSGPRPDASRRFGEGSRPRTDAYRSRPEGRRWSSSGESSRYGSRSRAARSFVERDPFKKKKKPRVFFHKALTRILLPKLLTKAKYLSPALAQQFIEAGRVRINARVVTSPFYEVNLRKERVTIDEAPTEYPRRLSYMVYNKPRNVVCTPGDPQFDEVFEPTSTWSFPFGRLDKAMSGLVVLSNDPRMVSTQHINDTELQKEYRVKINCHLGEEAIEELKQGVLLDDQYFVPLKVKVGRRNVDSMWLDLTVLDDAPHRIRQALKSLGCEILRMSRIRIALLQENMIPIGEWRELVAFEIPALGLTRFMRGELPPEPPPPPREKPVRGKFTKDKKLRGKEHPRDDRRGGSRGGRRDETPEDREERLRLEALADAAGNR